MTTAAHHAVLAAAVSASLLTTPFPALAAPSINDAIVEVSDSSYPVLKSLKAETFVPFSEKIGKLFLDINPDKLGRSVGLGIDVFTSAPPEKIGAFGGVVKDAFADLKPDSCTLVPLPSAALADKFSAVAADKVDAAKLKAFDDAYGPIIKSLSKSEGNAAICLPDKAALSKLSLAQADLARSFSPEQSKVFEAYTTPVLKSSITIGKVLPLVNDAKKLTPGATPGELAAFQAAGKKVELAAKAEAQTARLAELKARSAAIEAARAAGKPPPSAAPAKPVNAELQKELAEERAKAAKEAAEKKAAKLAEEAAKREKLKQDELDRIAALKAKSAAIQAAKEAAKQ